MAKILRINMTDRTAKVEDVPEAYAYLGGRWLTSTIVHDEVDPQCHALGPNNKLVFAPGIVTGTRGLQRFSGSGENGTSAQYRWKL